MQGGFLVVYSSAAQQLLVERTITLPWHYWLGVRRDNSSVPYKAVTGATVGPDTSNAGPYAHWWAACVVAACQAAAAINIVPH